MVMDMGLLAVSIYQTRPKSKQELQVTSFNPNATATAVEHSAATEFGPKAHPGIKESCFPPIGGE